jgi:beta-lactamase regulating signal transducer with metallopeptidase domain/5-hydroxyisourate hydrolase-like protein (transthyretin family)
MMETFTHIANSVPWDRLVQALLHSLWQGAIFAVVVCVLLRRIPAGRTNLRYGLTAAGLFCVLACAMATFNVLGGRQAQAMLDASPQIADRTTVVLSPTTPSSLTINSSAAVVPSPAQAPVVAGVDAPPPLRKQAWVWAAGVWIVGAALMLVRAGWLLRGANRLRRGCRIVSDGPLADTLDQLRRAMRIGRRVRLGMGEHIRVPAVFGIVWPIVLVPVAMANDMSLAHVRMILAHELAHVRRHDYLVNLMQLLVEALLFFNPAVWWLSRQVRIEREACCDALAVRATGSDTDYVRSLADAMANLLSLNQPGLGLTPAVSGGGGGMVDRAARVLRPSHRPQVRLSWYSLAGATVIAGVLLAGMWQGTQAAVQVAAEVAERFLSPDERVEKMAELQRELGPSNSGSVAQDDVLETVLSGTIRTADGSALPPGTQAIARTRSSSSSASYSLILGASGEFSQKVRAGRAQIWAQAPGYAPTFTDVLQPVAGTKDAKACPPVELVLTRGFEGSLRVTSDDGHALAGAKLELGYQLDPANEGNVVAQQQFVTNADGRATVPHASARRARATVELAGFQPDKIALTLSPTQPVEIKLRPARPTSGVVVDSGTRQPIAGATVTLLRRTGFDERGWYPHPRDGKPPVLAQTDAAGRFVLDALRDDCIYVLRASAAGHASEIAQDVRAGQSDLQWALGPSRAITLEIRADEGKMPQRVRVGNPLLIGDSSYDHGYDLPVTVKDGVGTARLEDPLPGVARFYVNERQVKVDVNTPRAVPVVVDLRGGAPKAKQLTRDVIVKLEWDAKGPPPRGKLRVDYIKPESPSSYHPDWIELKDGEVRLSVPVPTKFGYSQGEVVGYWIENKHEIPVPEGTKPLVITIPASPAGAIHGLLTDDKGLPFDQYFYVSIATVQQSPEVSDQRRPSMDLFDSRDHNGKYLISPIPLGGTYRLMARAGARTVVSDEIVIDAQQPIQTINLKFPEGITLQGRLMGSTGKPEAGCGVQLHYSQPQPPSSSFGTDVRSDRDGRFRFEHVDPKAGLYELFIHPGTQTQGLRVSPAPLDGKPIEIVVKEGLTARGTILDVETGKPMASVKVSLSPLNAKAAAYPWPIEAVTDQAGKFEARGLESIEYKIYVRDAYPPDAVVLRDEAGRPTGVRTTGSVRDEPTVTGGQAEPVEVSRLRSPWR